MDIPLESALESLRRDGFCVQEDYLSEERLHELRDVFERCLTDEQNGVTHFDHPPGKGFRLAVGEAERGGAKRWNASIFSAFDDRYLKELTAAYLPGAAFFSGVVGTSEFRPMPLTDVHFDTRRSLKFMIYLDDTTRENAAFCYLPGSHRRTAGYRRRYAWLGGVAEDIPNSLGQKFRDRVQSIEGPAGTLIAFDTDGLHAGGILQPGRTRRVLRAQCSLPEEKPSLAARFLPYRIHHSALSPACLYSRVFAPGYRATRGTSRAVDHA